MVSLFDEFFSKAVMLRLSPEEKETPKPDFTRTDVMEDNYTIMPFDGKKNAKQMRSFFRNLRLEVNDNPDGLLLFVIFTYPYSAHKYVDSVMNSDVLCFHPEQTYVLIRNFQYLLDHDKKFQNHHLSIGIDVQTADWQAIERQLNFHPRIFYVLRLK